MNDRTRAYDKISDIPADVLASRFVGTLIMAKGNLNKYKEITAHLIRELRGEPHPGGPHVQEVAEGDTEKGRGPVEGDGRDGRDESEGAILPTHRDEI